MEKTSCVLCGQNCALEVITVERRIIRVRGDRESPRSQGYLCRKGANIAYFQNNSERLKFPLKRIGDRFERISWDQALDEIAEKLKTTLQNYGPRSLAYLGGGGQGCHFQMLFGVPFLHGLGSKNYYNALGQELTGLYWVDGKSFGRQSLHLNPDIANSVFLVFWGINPMMSNRFPQAPLVIREKKKEPGFLWRSLIPAIRKQPNWQTSISNSGPARTPYFLKL